METIIFIICVIAATARIVQLNGLGDPEYSSSEVTIYVYAILVINERDEDASGKNCMGVVLVGSI